MRSTIALSSLLAATLALAACRTEPPAPAPAPAAPPSESAPSPAPDSGAVGLGPIRGSEYAARVRDLPGDVKVVNFWATWCGPCREELPDFVAVADSLRGQGVTLALVSVDEPVAVPQARAFLDRIGATRVVAPEANWIKADDEADEAFAAAVSDAWKGDLPVTGVYDRTGRQRAFLVGRTSKAALVRAIDAARTDG